MTEKMEGQLSIFDLDIWSGRMFLGPSPATEEKTSKRFSRKSSGSQTQMPQMCLCLKKNGRSLDACTMSWADGQLLGEFTMPSFGEYPKEENASRLSQILEDSPHPKYALSAKACLGILNRAERRGKELPKELKEALIAQSSFKATESTEPTQQDATEKDGVTGGVCYTLNTIDRPAVYDASRRHSYEPFGEVCETVQAAYGTGGNNQPLVVQPIAIEMTSTKNTIVKDGICPTLTARMGTGGNQVNAVYCTDIGFFTSHEEKAGTLLARQYKDPPVVNIQKMVRRLTPTECERLQGFQDGWTDIGEWTDSKGKKHKPSDSPRYKALGNSIALPFWFYLLRRISAQYERSATLGSLFDGIGGFPLCWERCNGKGTALWASEIEEFPIAVTKLRFPENQ